MSKYIPYPFYENDVPIDISFVFGDEKPAGKHGFMKTNGNKFVFEDGTEALFWGTNFNGGANFPTFAESEMVAKRLSKIGINLVRLHQLDSEWNTPNIFQFSKGKRQTNTMELDPESMERLDYLIYCLKREGIYCYMDMFTYRKFKSGDGVENADLLVDAAKPYSYFNKRMIELQKKLCYDLWTHVNPYTKLAYKDDPVFVMAEITNENDLFCKKIEIEPYVTEFRELFYNWTVANNIEYDTGNCDINNCEDEVLTQFKVYLQEKYYMEFMNLMHDIGVKAQITGTNWLTNNACSKTQMVTDFQDMHWYFYDWRWGEYDKFCMNTAITQVPDCGYNRTSMMRSLDKPFFVSEWDVPWPNEYRAESTVLSAAVGCLQGWSGFAIHTYAYTSDLTRMKILGKEMSSSQIGNIPYREGIFSTWNDPAKFGLFYHGALITRRKDIAKANGKVVIDMTDLTGPNSKPEFNAQKKAFTAISEMTAVGSEYIHKEKAEKPNDQYIVDLSKEEVVSDTNQLYRSWKYNYGTIDSDMTKCVYGFLGKMGAIEINDLKINCKTDFAVVAMSSLSENKISSSDNILLTVVGRSRNTDAVFEGEQMLEYGRPPVMIEVIEADIELKTDKKTMKIWAVSAEGYLIGEVPHEYTDGTLKFNIGETSCSMYYLLQAE